MRFAPGISSGDREGLVQVIADLDEWSLVHKFAFGHLISSFEVMEAIEATEVLVTKPWHQTEEPHFTVQLRLTTSWK